MDKPIIKVIISHLGKLDIVFLVLKNCNFGEKHSPHFEHGIFRYI